jgi:hypothetical protein
MATQPDDDDFFSTDPAEDPENPVDPQEDPENPKTRPRTKRKSSSATIRPFRPPTTAPSSGTFVPS